MNAELMSIIAHLYSILTLVDSCFFGNYTISSHLYSKCCFARWIPEYILEKGKGFFNKKCIEGYEQYIYFDNHKLLTCRKIILSTYNCLVPMKYCIRFLVMGNLLLFNLREISFHRHGLRSGPSSSTLCGLK